MFARFCFHTMLVCTGGPALLLAGPGACKDIPLRFTLFHNAVSDPATGATIPSALFSDGGGEYINGVSGVWASIKVCAATYDAVLNVDGRRRAITFQFPSPISGSVIEAVPNWVPGQYAASGWINVRNILYSRQPFTTRAGVEFTPTVDRSTYRLRFMPFQVDAPDLHKSPPNLPAENTPFPSSPAMVYPTYPAICGPGSMPSWLVRGTNFNSHEMMQVGTLHKVPTRGTPLHEGQYTMPFEFLVEALQCFSY